MNPKPLRPYVRVDYSGNYGTALVYPYVLAVSSCAPDKFNAKLTPFDIDELAARANASRLADSGQRFYPTIVYDATEATKAAI